MPFFLVARVTRVLSGTWDKCLTNEWEEYVVSQNVLHGALEWMGQDARQ